ncbi:ABC-type transport system, involved in lipoprotein release, permease component [Chitinispirillum alkaliphilum]|nr:ABC-type transport system, involved in lipoprotein release, permease component [Chitinispirillum alkaliphilum]
MAWKNIWRNKVRSMIIITAIALGLLAGLLASALTIGMGEQIIRTTVRTRISHIQITHPDFRLEQDVNMYIPDAALLSQQLRALPQVQAAAPRILVDAMASSPRSAQGVQLVGVLPQYERDLVIIDQVIVDGVYFDEEVRNPVVIGEALAQRLDIRVGSRMVMTFQDVEGIITGGAFRVSGLFRTPSTEFDRSTVYVMAEDLAQHLDTEQPWFHEVSALFISAEAADESVSLIRDMAEGLRVETWRELAPELDYISETLSVFLYIFMLVILAALAFGIINTMLMVVLERTKEFGMLMAVGMKRNILFKLIVLETVALSLTGALAGILLSFITISLLGQTGVDLSVFAEGLREFGVEEVLYPELPLGMYPALSLMVIVVAVMAAVYPALKALKLKPADALRSS